MDILTHFLFGTLLGMLLGIDNRMIIILGAASIAPDFDMLSILLGINSYFKLHRGIFHSFVGAFFVSLLTVLTYSFSFNRIDWRQIIIIASLGSVSHIVLDVLTPWKLPLFYPVGDKVSFDLFYYFDYLILITLIATNLIIYKLSLTGSMRLTVIILCLVILSSIVYIRFYEKSLASRYGEPLPTIEFNTWYSVNDKNNTIIVYKIQSGYVVNEWKFNKPIFSEGAPPINSTDKAVGYSLRSEMVGSFLTRARYPVVEVENVGNNYTVIWSDVMFKIERASVISGIKVNISEKGEINSEVLRRY